MNSFDWYVSSSFAACAFLADVSLDEGYQSPAACAKVFETGRRKVAEVFGPEVILGAPSCPPISYGHVACLGAPLTYPTDSEPAVGPVFDSLDAGIKALENQGDFSEGELFRSYWDMYEYLKDRFPDESFPFGGFKWEGPITTAVLLRGQDFYIDLYDVPDRAKLFLDLITESIIRFVGFLRNINREPAISATGTGLSDDFASLISPDLWSEFVVPFWQKYYTGLTTGSRGIHVENLGPDHLKYLREVGIEHYDPSVSPQLSPAIIKREIDIPLSWRLASFDLDRMNDDDVKQWVCRCSNEGADLLFTIVEKNTCLDENPGKIGVFIETCREMALDAKGKRAGLVSSANAS